jgi:hypothetical protein
MPRYALIENTSSRVVNIVSVPNQENLTPKDKDYWTCPAGHRIVESDGAAIDDAYKDGEFTKPDAEPQVE